MLVRVIGKPNIVLQGIDNVFVKKLIESWTENLIWVRTCVKTGVPRGCSILLFDLSANLNIFKEYCLSPTDGMCKCLNERHTQVRATPERSSKAQAHSSLDVVNDIVLSDASVWTINFGTTVKPGGASKARIPGG